MIWILAQSDNRLVYATAVAIEQRSDMVEAPTRFELWARAGGENWRIGVYARFADAQDAFSAVIEAARTGAGFVDLRTV